MTKKFNSKRSLEIQKEMFDFSRTSPRKGSWWWWFLILIFNNPKNESNPRQLMILWSTKKDKEIECNDLRFTLDHSIVEESKGKRVDGAVTSWYYDGKKMWHNFLLKQTPLLFSKEGIKTENIETEFYRTKKGFKLNIKNKIKFDLYIKEKNIFTMPTHDSKKLFGFNYELLRMNRLDLNGVINGEKVKGSAYLQRVFLNAPAMPWYWGVFYFKNNVMLTYLKINSGKTLGEIPLKKDIQFYYKGKFHKIKNMKVKKKIEKELPVFDVEGEDKEIKISFQVTPYSSSYWKFRKKFLGIKKKSKFIWYEYPSTIEKIRLVNKRTGEELTEKDLGIGIGNAEQSHGFLI